MMPVARARPVLRAACRALASALGAATLFALAGCSGAEPPAAGGEPALRRLTESQYRHAIRDVFGTHIVVGGRFDPLARVAGLEAVGAARARITPSGFEQYWTMARSIATQVVAPANRATAFPCAPRDPAGADDDCARQFFSEVGRLLYRRPLQPAELAVAVESAGAAAREGAGFFDGVGAALAAMLAAPQFLFIVDSTEAAGDGRPRLTAYARAARLSFMLWDTTPDPALLDAAARGALDTRAGLEREVDRLLGSPRVEDGLRAFFSDMLELDRFELLEKDPVIYPAFVRRAAEDAREQILRTVVDHVLVDDADYRELFTRRRTVMNDTLARLYRVPTGRPDGAWVAHEFTAGEPRAGLLSLVGFTALYSHPGVSSPTLRGRAIRESLLCQTMPGPPANVDFSGFNSPDARKLTARERLLAHSTVQSCAGCHRAMDPLGLGLENFDGAGMWRSMEAGRPIEVAGELDGEPFDDAASLGAALGRHPALPSCLVQRAFAWGAGRAPLRADNDYLAHLGRRFAAADFRVLRLMRELALSDAPLALRTP